MKEIHDNPKLDDSHFQELNKFSPDFKKCLRMTKANLINKIAMKLYFKHGGTIREHSKMVALKKLDNIQLAYWLHTMGGK